MTQPGEATSYTEYRVHYRYGVNSGTLIGRNPESMIESHSRLTMGDIGAYKIERREVIHYVTEWELTDDA